MDAHESFQDELFARGILIPSGVDGLYGRNETFEAIVDGLDALISSWGREDGPEVMRFPPAISRRQLEESEYLKSFPHLAGTVHSFAGDERAHRHLVHQLECHEDWTPGQKATDVALTPAACYPVYPAMARRGRLPAAGRLVDVYSYCFRHEPSIDPARMQMFRQREYVRIGTAGQVQEFRTSWLDRGRRIVSSLGLPLRIELANDLFFGRGGKVMASSQRAQELKFELLVPITSASAPTACVSFNYHQDHFGQLWTIETEGGDPAHTACVGFGMERLTLALLRHHGLDPAQWPEGVRALLGVDRWPH